MSLSIRFIKCISFEYCISSCVVSLALSMCQSIFRQANRCLYVCLFVWIYLSVFLSFRPSVHLSVWNLCPNCLSVYPSLSVILTICWGAVIIMPHKPSLPDCLSFYLTWLLYCLTVDSFAQSLCIVQFNLAVCLSICLSVCLSICLYVHPSVYLLYICSSDYIHFRLSVYLAVYLSVIWLSVYLPVYLLSICLYVYLYVHMSIHLFIGISISVCRICTTGGRGKILFDI